MLDVTYYHLHCPAVYVHFSLSLSLSLSAPFIIENLFCLVDNFH
jgi:hypothetical protein